LSFGYELVNEVGEVSKEEVEAADVCGRRRVKLENGKVEEL
jgi:hypothetical protein